MAFISKTMELGMQHRLLVKSQCFLMFAAYLPSVQKNRCLQRPTSDDYHPQ